MSEPVNFGDFWDKLCRQMPLVGTPVEGYLTGIGMLKLINTFATPMLHAQIMMAIRSSQGESIVPLQVQLASLRRAAARLSGIRISKDIMEAAKHGKKIQLHKSCRKYCDPKLTLAYCALVGWPTVVRGRVIIPKNPEQVPSLPRRLAPQRTSLFDRIGLRRRSEAERLAGYSSPPPEEPRTNNPREFPHIRGWLERIEEGVQSGTPLSSAVPLDQRETQRRDSLIFGNYDGSES